MEVIDSFSGKVVALDTSPLIYFIEEHGRYLRFLKAFFEANARGHFLAVTSTVTLLEVLVQPYRQNRLDLVDKYKAVFSGTSSVELISLRSDVAAKAAEFRAKYDLRTPDAIQVATAASAPADYLLSNDRKLKRIELPQVLILDDICD